MKILVLGGTGAMGIHLVQLLSESGHTTYVTSRTKHEPKNNIQFIQGNARNIDFISRLLEEKWDAIIDFMVYTTAEFKQKYKLFLQSTKQYIFISSARVYADSNEPITEISPRLLDISKDVEYLSSDEYALTKARQEDILQNSGKTNWTIIRPYITYSENRLQLGVLEKEEWLYRALHGKTIVFSKDIASKITTLTYGFDVSKGIFAIIGNKKSLGQIFHITSNESVTWQQVLDIYLKVLEKYLEKKPKVLLQELKDFELWRPSKYQIYYDRLYNRKFDNTKIASFVDVQSYTILEEGLSKSIEKFIQNPTFANINWTAEALKDKYTNEYTSLIKIYGVKQKFKYLVIRYFYRLYVLLKK